MTAGHWSGQDARLRLVRTELLNPARVGLLEHIAHNPGTVPTSSTARALGIPYGSLSWHLRVLTAAGLIRKPGKKWAHRPAFPTAYGRHCLWFAQQVIR